MAKKKMDETDEAPEVLEEAPQIDEGRRFDATRVYQLGQLAQSGNASEGELRELWGHIAALKPSDGA